jgi:HAD superfamily hydrolase (TIGR01509 family)
MKFDAILFDCDGVLVDSEGITNGVLRSMLDELGWQMSQAECMRLFIGKLVQDQAALIEEKTGTKFSEEWLASFRARRNAALQESLVAVAHIEEALLALQRVYGTKMACASGADRAKIELQLRKTKLLPFFEGRIFSGVEMPRSKPAPDVYLAAAAALGVDPTRCAVVEDTTTGATAGIAAGCTVFGYCPDALGHSSAEALRAVGAAKVFGSMRELAELLV